MKAVFRSYAYELSICMGINTVNACIYFTSPFIVMRLINFI